MPVSLESGVMVSRYSIVGPIGAGGMGEVYQAQDASLERMVALKILPPDVVKNDERRRRFVQEAKSASSLNHPHIVTIHEIGEATLEGSGQTIHYIAMELIDGVTLKHKIHKEQAGLRTILTWLAQAAEGLAKAHAAGIVHRDLKPENIMVSRDGFAKVLDFGLAKLSVRKSASETMDATLARENTREGAILGTVAYMSPEQVMGKVVDHRSDVFSFGAILYEAATRRRPFEADSDVDLMHKILHDAPEPVDVIDPSVPSEVRRLIRRCLAKDPERRFQSMKDLSIDLREIVESWDELSASTTSHGSGSRSTADVAAVQKRSPALWIAIGIAAIAIAALAFVALRNRQSSSTARAPKTAALKVRRLTTNGNVLQAAMSRDGRYLALAVRDREGRRSLRVRQVETGSEVEVAPVAPQVFAGVSFSPDGNYVYYTRRDDQGGTTGWLYRVATLGGTPRKVIYDVDTAVSFSPDGKQLAFGRGAPQSGEHHYIVANVDGSAPRIAARFPRFTFPLILRPVWSADGKKLMIARMMPPGGTSAGLSEVDLASGTHRDIGAGEWWWVTSLAYTSDAGMIMAAIRRNHGGGAQLWLQPLAGGEPQRITNDFSNYGHLSLSADGKALAAVSTTTDGELLVASPDDPDGGTPVDEERSRGIAELSTSASGAVVYLRQDEMASDIAIVDAPGSQPRLLTSRAQAGEPSIAADRKTIVYTSFATEPTHIWAIDADGGAPRQITSGDGEHSPLISPDGKTLLYVAGEAIWKRPLSGGTAVKLSDRPANGSAFSSDSRLVAYRYWTATDPTIRLRVEPVAGGAPVLDVPSRILRSLRFSPRDDGITFVGSEGGGDQILLQPLKGGEPVQLTKFKRGTIGSYGWTPDGKLAYIRTESRGDVVVFEGL